MTATLEHTPTIGPGGSREPGPGVGRHSQEPAWRRFLHRPVGVVAAAWLLVVAVGAVFASVLEPYSSQTQDLSAALGSQAATWVA
jgi:ABC-type antimicrobial peptide transport system permease subunit